MVLLSVVAACVVVMLALLRWSWGAVDTDRPTVAAADAVDTARRRFQPAPVDVAVPPVSSSSPSGVVFLPEWAHEPAQVRRLGVARFTDRREVTTIAPLQSTQPGRARSVAEHAYDTYFFGRGGGFFIQVGTGNAGPRAAGHSYGGSVGAALASRLQVQLSHTEPRVGPVA